MIKPKLMFGKFRVASTALAVGCALLMARSTLAGDDTHNTDASEKQLTQEQIDVYGAVLEEYRHGDNQPLNVANATEPLEKPDSGCVDFDVESHSPQVVHRFSSKIAPDLNIVLVDPKLQQEKIEQNDPQNLIKGAIDEGKHVTEEQLNSCVRVAFASGLFTFSEIGFDKQHRHAIVAYRFVCGTLCGHGNTVILERTNGKWKVKKQCGGWIS